MPARKSKSDRLPKYGSLERDLLLSMIHGVNAYKESVKKGLPFFTLKELKSIETKYSDGITWAEIDGELARKGIILKKATFRRYVNAKLISSSIGYRKNKKGREALFPTDTIANINFIQYFFRIADDDVINVFIDFMAAEGINAKQAIENKLEASLYGATLNNLKGISDDDVEEAIQEVLSGDEKFMNEVLTEYVEMISDFEERYQRWEKLLESGKKFYILHKGV